MWRYSHCRHPSCNDRLSIASAVDRKVEYVNEKRIFLQIDIASAVDRKVEYVNEKRIFLQIDSYNRPVVTVKVAAMKVSSHGL